MLKELIEKYLKKKQRSIKSVVQDSDRKQQFDITITRNGNVIKIDVSDYISIIDYVDRMKELDQFNLLDLLGNAVLWNSKIQGVNKGTYFVITHGDYLYNVLIGGEETIIDERIKVDDHTVEKHVNLHINGEYNYTHFKHDKVGSTYYTMYYSKRGFPIKNFELSKEDAYEGIDGLLTRFEETPGCSEILDVDSFRKSILDDLIPKSDGVVKK
jgi:hypothetical protein